MESRSVHIHPSFQNKSHLHLLIIPAIVFVVSLYLALTFFSKYRHAEITQIESRDSAVLGEQDESVK